MTRKASERHYFNADDVAAALNVAQSELIALGVPQSRWTVGTADFGHVSLRWGFHAVSSVATGAVPADTAVLGVGSHTDTWTLNRMPYSERTAIFLPPCADFVGAFSSPGNFCFLSAPYEWLLAQGDHEMHERLDPRTIRTFDLGHAAAARARAGLVVARNFALHQDEFVECPQHRATMEKSIVASFFGALDSADEIVLRSDPRLARRLVEYLRAHPDEPLFQEDLTAALETSRRSLRRVFADHFGTSPGSYLRMRRMHLARRALVRGDCASVTEAAVRFGFFDLGRFAGTYKLMFGEIPSETIRSGFSRRRAKRKMR